MSTESAQLGLLLGSVHTEEVDLKEKLDTRIYVAHFIVEELPAMLYPFLRSLVEKLCTGFKTQVSDAFQPVSTGSQFYVATAIKGITLGFSGGPASKNGNNYSKGKEVIDFSAALEFVKLSIVFFLLSAINKRCFVSFYFFLFAFPVVHRSLEMYHTPCFPISVRRLRVVHLLN